MNNTQRLSQESINTIFFNESTHTYTTHEDKELISVTTLMKKHSLSPSFDNVPEHILEASRLRGNQLHKQTEVYLSSVFPDSCNNAEFEITVANDHVAGTIDAMFYDDYGQLYIVDLKTGQYLEDSCRWQLSLYEYLYNSQNKAKLVILHLDKENKLSTIDLTDKRIARQEIERLIQSDKDGIIFTFSEYCLTVKSQEYANDLKYIQDKIGALERQIAALKEVEAQARLAILSEMTKRGIDSVQTPTLLIKYVGKSVRHSFDTTAFKADNPEIYSKYLKDSVVKEHLKITIKGECK